MRALAGLHQTTAFGLTGLVAIDSYPKSQEVKAKYGVPVHVYKPEGCDTAADFEKKYGEKYWEEDEEIYDYLVKVEPARRAYEERSVKSVITGRRASQGADRANLQPLEVDNTGLLKLNPLFAWTFPFVDWYIKSNNVPHNKLLDQGYRSVGDWHSTVKSGEGDTGERAGRWAGKADKTECGLHVDYFKMKAAAQKRYVWDLSLEQQANANAHPPAPATTAA
ncbi:Phosphoadenosine phosphosulfate reductase [Grifola frondosa]|uniref:Phosphoadenosine phosphosulfate reductase n=1 Tax=Grifola frondosa TaxID=5627 RepID=A0A1C7M0F0_GRIFR|nr:Phosphoadenosine phosphosulfate reductase [Grifola frondosa]